MAPIINGSYAEYSSLLEYCQKYGKAIWPLLFDKVAQRDVFVINLLRDLTYTGNTNFIDAITKHLIETGKPWFTSMDIQINYCKELLANEEVNIMNSIKAISGSNTEPLVLDVSANNNREILLNMYSEQDKKAIISIYDISGNQVYKSNHHFSKGNQKVVMRNSKLKKGIYIVHVTAGGETTSQTISI